MLYQNVRGLNTKLKSLFISSLTTDLDIICLTETWLKSNTFNSEVFGSTFNVYRKDRFHTSSYGGGVLIAISSKFSSVEININLQSDIEFCSVFVKFSAFKLYITCSYIPPSSPIEIYDSHFHAIKDVFSKLSENDHIIVFGDFNCPSVTWVPCELDPLVQVPVAERCSVMSFFDKLASLGLIQINSILNHQSKLLDLIFVDNVSNIDISRCSPLVSPEDDYHPTIEVALEAQPVSIQPDPENFEFCFKRTNVARLTNLLQSTDWFSIIPDSVLDAASLDCAVERFCNLMISYFEKCTPKIKMKREQTPHWFNKYLKSLRNKKSRLYKKYRRSGCSRDRINYIRTKNFYQLECKCAYDKFIYDTTCNIRSNPNHFWSFMSLKRKSSGSPSIMRYNNNQAETIPECCKLFAQYFQSVYSTSVNNTMNYPHLLPQFDITMPSIDVENVELCAKNIKPSFKSGPDGIPPFIINKCSASLADPLSKLFNLSLKIGYFPKHWRSSFVVPLFKSGNTSDISNYRGIAKLSAIPKLFELIITKQIMFNVNKIITPYQHGFLAGKSTTTNLLTLTSFIHNSFLLNQQTDVIYTDFSKAFDVVNHSLLLTKLVKYGFPTCLVAWLESYLTDRSQKVLFKSCLSTEIKVTSGVPQGSHLGPLLFLLFINDLPQAIKHSSMLMYADDVKVFNSFDYPDGTLQIDLTNLADWCALNLIALNIKKCKTMTFARKRVYHSNVYHINNVQLESVESFTDLGILFDRKLSFNLHIDKIVNKASSLLGCLKRWAKEFNDPYVTKLLFTSLVRPILEYGTVIWSPCYQCHIDRIESVQKQFLIFCLRSLGWSSNESLPPYKSRLKLINLPSLGSRRKLLNCLFIYNVLLGNINTPDILELLKINVPLRSLRSYSFLKLEYYNKNYLNFNAYRVACKDFNELYEHFDFNLPLNSIKRNILTQLNK